MLTNITISKKLLGLFLVNITVLLIIIGNGSIFTNNSAIDIKNIKENILPISELHTENLHLLESIMNSFADAAVTNEKDISTSILKLKSNLLDNLHKLQQYKVDVTVQERMFQQYFDFTHSFTLSIIENKNNFVLEDAQKLQKYSSEILFLFKEKKDFAKEDTSLILTNISDNTNLFFKNSLIVSFIGFFIMLTFGLLMNHYVKNRFESISLSFKNLLKEKPDFSIRLLGNENDEIGDLIKLFNQLSDKLEFAHNKSSQEFLQEIEDTQKEVVFTMGAIGESRSKETGNHVKRVAEYSKLLALYYGLDEHDAEMLKQASPMHDIGKVAIPDAILNKPGRFNDEERAIMDQHVILGHEMLKHSHRPLLEAAAIVALEHHEKWDGTGYPNAKRAEDIHIYGRITALADVFDALGSDRVYKKAWDDERIFTLFKNERAKQFDPKLIDLFFENIEEFMKIRDKFKD